ncbi:Fis family transcriptional regulator [Sorangium cellulosum]|uniref:Fis family transcriptional regulator n=2 Tax=Sorangium cellulosum TaxID=56 RepID=A0A4P2Q0G3_SORCE|nr:Fis family transcriptional regulator [Sorangium cellulosum]
MRSSAMRDLDRVLRTVAPKEVGISLVGESGTGKEVLARRIHDLSHRRSGPFIPINCAAVPEPLFESELFGYERGAFTGAASRTRGKIEVADGGTLFLDEIGEMPVSVQAKLLRFLENRKFMRVGGTEKISVDARIVCATLRPLEEEVKAGRFRGDLYYRIQGVALQVPPLRERQADLPPLVHLFLQQLAAKHGTPPARMTRAAMAALRRHDWPGNVRELRNVIELVTLLRAGKQVRVHDLPRGLRDLAQVREAAPAARAGGRRVIEISLDATLDESIGKILDAALSLEGGNRSRAAARLGISLRTVQRYLAGLNRVAQAAPAAS